jgi:tetratricopeptide (TPR) repeat protein
MFGLFGSSKLKKENARLMQLVEELQGTETAEIEEKLEEKKLKLIKLDKSERKVLDRLIKVKSDIKQKESQLIELDETVMLESFALYRPKFALQNSEQYKTSLDRVRKRQKQMIKDKTAATGDQEWVVNGKKAQGKKMMNDMVKLVIRSFNNECDMAVTKVKFNNMDSCKKRLEKSYEALNKLGNLMQVSISPHYKQLKYDELYLAHEYQIKKQEEKEHQKMLREQIREEAKLKKEIEEARKSIYKEQKHYTNALTKLNKQIATSSDPIELKDLEVKIAEIQSQLGEIDKNLKDIDYREANKRAGYVYVISNIGSFGKNIYKIGMTRRLEPMDRVHELGDASVPFNFDVHAMMFSDDAPTLENTLHKAFENKKVNMVNTRREFFNVSLNEIENVIKNNYDKTVDFVELAPAEHYRESIKMKGMNN